jgi:hypothetical protein
VTPILGNSPTHGTPWTVDQGIGWLREQVERKTTGWHNVCLGITAKASGYAASGTVPARPGRSGWAIEAWRQAGRARKHRGKFANVPRGGIIHYKGRWGTPGHTTISNGDGREFTNDAVHDRITLEPIGKTAAGWGMKMVGWREPEFKRGAGRNPSNPRPIPAPAPPVKPKPKPTAGRTKVTHPSGAWSRKAPDPRARGVKHRAAGQSFQYVAVRKVDGITWLRTVAGNWVRASRTSRGA